MTRLDAALELARSLRPRLTDSLVALDFDGTLAPIVPDPEDSRPVDGAVDALVELAGRGARIAIITGRDARTVLRLGGLERVPGLTVAGVYGAEIWHDGELETPETPEAVLHLRERLPAAVAGGDPKVWIEDKRLSLVVHTRLTADPDTELDRIREAVTTLGEELGFDVHPGSGVLELRIPGHDKGAVLRDLAAGRGAVLYAGDDLGDLPAFGEIQRLRGLGVAALGFAVAATGAGEVADAADAVVDEPEQMVTLLRSLLD